MLLWLFYTMVKEFIRMLADLGLRLGLNLTHKLIVAGFVYLKVGDLIILPD